MNGSQWLVHALAAEGVDTLFGYPGGAIMPFYDALYGSGLKHALVRHEQGAAFAANGLTSFICPSTAPTIRTLSELVSPMCASLR